MAHKRQWDFNCPQYVDFLAGMDSNSEDVYFDCDYLHSPLVGEVCKNSPVPEKVLTEVEENRLINKMTAALSIIENTPKLKVGIVRGKLFAEKSPLKNLGSQTVKQLVMPNTVAVSSSRIYNKSVCVVNKVHTEKPNKTKAFRPKRSSSLNDLRTFKKYTYPKTPLCLKRTIKAKTKALKTTEELELEQIAELQKQLSQLLKNNEISYNRLKLKQRPCVQKAIEIKPEGNADINTDRHRRRDFHTLSHAAMKRETLKLDAIISNKEIPSKSAKNTLKDVLEKSKNPSVSSSFISEENDKNRTQTKKPIKYGFHSGLVFRDNVKKNTVVKPFSFDVKIKGMLSQNAEVSLTKSVLNHNGKENIPVSGRPNLVMKKPIDVQNIKSDIKLLASNKKILRQCYGNPLKGLPFAENYARN